MWGRPPFVIGKGLFIAAFSGALAALAHPPFDLWPLIFVAFVPMILAQHRYLPRKISGIALGLGIGGWFASVLMPGMIEGGVNWYYLLLPVYITILVGVLCWRSRIFQERTLYRWFVISAPIAWVGLDFLRMISGITSLGGTFGNPAYALYKQVWFLQPVSIFGIFGLQFLILSVNWGIAGVVLAFLAKTDDQSSKAFDMRLAKRQAAVTGVMVLLWVLTSIALLSFPKPSVRVAAVQPGMYADSKKFVRSSKLTELDRLMELKRDMEMTRIASDEGAKLVVWRENGLNFDPQIKDTEKFKQLALDTGAYLAVGYQVPGKKVKRNEATLISPQGHFLGKYGKDHPGEFADDYSDTKGKFYPVYETEIGRIATIICYDLDFTDTARKMARNGAQLIAVPSSDVPSLSYRHFTHLVFRAIENRVSMVKADSMFDSAIIDPYGRVLSLIKNFRGEIGPHVLVADVPILEKRPILVKLGDWLGWVCVAGMTIFLLMSIFIQITGKKLRKRLDERLP